jgi:hypothetical protein
MLYGGKVNRFAKVSIKQRKNLRANKKVVFLVSFHDCDIFLLFKFLVLHVCASDKESRHTNLLDHLLKAKQYCYLNSFG